ncbi:class I SAM-dependent methyltransferase [Brevibacterium sp.]|uniref:class I SAM-dependent methyltransferase n=1 Tax=Brevibacterium sp. TaxID=1701 RepID=UPI0025BDB592|nr:class I SAM-dependent methyltransferase [Brevibacterium sp.]
MTHTSDTAAREFAVRLRAAHAGTAMHGWDFSVLDGRLAADDPPWDFEAQCARALAEASAAVDLGTGGGERLIRLLREVGESGGAGRDGPRKVSATEAWPPNLPRARTALEPWGVTVYDYDADRGDRLPFPDASVDLVMCRHESFDIAEIARVLRRGGLFLNQQVDGRDAQELRDWFGGEPQAPHVRLANAETEAEAAGLRVTHADEWAGTMEFSDAEALVTYMALVPWDVPGFEVDPHLSTLAQLDAERPIRVTQRRFRCCARRP